MTDNATRAATQVSAPQQPMRTTPETGVLTSRLSEMLTILNQLLDEDGSARAPS